MEDDIASPTFDCSESFARRLDAEDPIATYRCRFHLPTRRGEPLVYLCGHSLGLQPRGVRNAIEHELRRWADLGVRAHFEGKTPWYHYDDDVSDLSSRLVGARPDEVVIMNGLTVNLHLAMVSFYRPTPRRYKVLMEAGAFPSDHFAVGSQIRYHGFDPQSTLLLAAPRPAEQLLRIEDLEQLLDERGEEIALVFLPGVNYLTGQAFDIARITAAAKRKGCLVGFDLAHAVGNLELKLHEWSVDFAVWCSYKYLNSGPGASAGCFIHDTYLTNLDMPRLLGWWGHDPATRLEMGVDSCFSPRAGAASWSLSNPPILSMAPLRVSLEIFDEVGMPALRRKSVRLTGYLEYLIRSGAGRHFEIISPRDPEARGCQLSLRLRQADVARLLDHLREEHVECDFRQPNLLRVAPVPLYNTFHDVWRFANALQRWRHQ